jgi:methionyl-tRNA synthetase
MLMSARLPLPAQVFGHGWVFFKGERMSKSLGNMVDPLDAAKRFGPDPLRLYLTKEVPYGGDGDFTWERFEEKYNADLANNLGNLVNRVAIDEPTRYQQGRLPAGRGASARWRRPPNRRARLRTAMERLALHDAVQSAFRLISQTNEFIAGTSPGRWRRIRPTPTACSMRCCTMRPKPCG